MKASLRGNSFHSKCRVVTPFCSIMGRRKHIPIPIHFTEYDSDDDYGGVFGSSFASTNSHAHSQILGKSYSIRHGSMSETTINQDVNIKPRNPNQEHYVRLLESKQPSVVLGVGASGSGKTMLAVGCGVKKLKEGVVHKLVLTRPAVSVEEQHGFLPGTLEEKMEPWLRPVFDVFHKYMSAKQVEEMIRKQIIEICPLAYMRGRTFEDAWIIADEMQNATPNQMIMLLTRIGRNSKMVITGDPFQHDRGYESNGLTDLLQRIVESESESSSDIQVVEFNEKDIERHPVIRQVLNLYKLKSIKS
jgi:phosphate starvation-inducible protein PhoH and related proteins